MDWLREQANVKEKPFQSNVPLVGGVVVRLRTAWNDVAARWYVQALQCQQNEFNQTIVTLYMDQNEKLVALDKENVQLTRTIAQFELQVKRLQRQIDSLQSSIAPISSEEMT